MLLYYVWYINQYDLLPLLPTINTYRMNKKEVMLHEFITRYLELNTKVYNAGRYAYAAYNAPHTTYTVSDDLDEVLCECSPSAIKLWHMIMLRLKRSTDATEVVAVKIQYMMFNEKVSRNTYQRAMKELLDKELLLYTPANKQFIVNIKYAHKCYKPKPMLDT